MPSVAIGHPGPPSPVEGGATASPPKTVVLESLDPTGVLESLDPRCPASRADAASLLPASSEPGPAPRGEEPEHPPIATSEPANAARDVGNFTGSFTRLTLFLVDRKAPTGLSSIHQL